MSYQSPFAIWFDANITQMAVSPEILKLLARAFEGGKIDVEAKRKRDNNLANECFSKLEKENAYLMNKNEFLLAVIKEKESEIAILRKANEK